jgi:chitinase
MVPPDPAIPERQFRRHNTQKSQSFFISGGIMKSVIVVLCLAMLASANILLGQQIENSTGGGKEIIGYYPSWKWRTMDNPMTPEKIPYRELTTINYAFFYPLPDGEIVGRDSVGDEMMLKGERDSATGTFKSGTALTELAHRHGVKVLLSIGGWADSYNFPEVASSDTTRKAFAHSCVEQIKEFGFDGIDIDWEFPGYVDHKGTPNDKINCTLLLQTTRDSLDALGKLAGRKFLLTAALPAGAETAAGFEIEKISSFLDMLNVMTYDFCGPWDSLSGYNSPLYSPRADDSVRNVDAAFKLYTQTYNIPASKINIGVPFYAHTFMQCTAPYTTFSGSDTIRFPLHGSDYNDVVKVMDKFKRYWDDRAKVPYLVSSEWNEFISYDDEESVEMKAQYVLDNNAHGVGIWEITGDYLPNGGSPLLNVIYTKFNSRGQK